MRAKSKKVIGLAALGTLSAVDLIQLQQGSAIAATFTGSLVANPHGGSVQVSITVNAGRITAITTPIQPTGSNSSYSNFAIPTLTSEALVAQSANIQGVSGASQISAAWKQSLAAAISSAGSAIGVQAVPTPTPVAPTPTQPAPSQSTAAANPTTTSGTSTSTSSTPSPASSNCATTPPITTTLPDVTSAPVPQGNAIPSGAPIPQGFPTPLSTQTTSAGERRVTTITVGQNQIQNYIQNQVQTVTKSQIQTQVITCNYTATPTATPTVTVFVTTTPTPTEAPFVIKPGAGVVLKTFVCSKTAMGKLVKKTVKATVVKCPTGYKLVKK